MHHTCLATVVNRMLTQVKGKYLKTKLGMSNEQASDSPRYITTNDFDTHVGFLPVIDDCECTELLIRMRYGRRSIE
jgi:hypothetical protein